MKKIFVTVEEFLENGGVLQDNTIIYRRAYFGEFSVKFVYVGWYLHNKETIADIDACLEIDCTPHYI